MVYFDLCQEKLQTIYYLFLIPAYKTKTNTKNQTIKILVF